MVKRTNPLRIRLPQGWPESVKSVMLRVISLAQFSMAYTRGWAVNSPIPRLRLKAENDQLKQDLALLKKEIRIKKARMNRIDSHKRPHCAPSERLSILEVRAAKAWSVRETDAALRFLLLLPGPRFALGWVGDDFEQVAGGDVQGAALADDPEVCYGARKPKLRMLYGSS